MYPTISEEEQIKYGNSPAMGVYPDAWMGCSYWAAFSEEENKVISHFGGVPAKAPWMRFVFDGHFCEAKVFNFDSEFGIRGGRVSEIFICNGAKWNIEDVLFEYDHDMTEGPLTELVSKIVDYCELAAQHRWDE